MNNKEQLELAHWVVSEAIKKGADQAAVDISNSRQIDVEFRDRKMQTLNEATSRSLSLTIYSKNRFSNHTTNDIRREALTPFIEEAIGMTGYLGEDIHRTLPDPKYYEGRSNLDLDRYDGSYGDVVSDERIRIAREVEEAALAAEGKIISVTSGYSDSRSESVKVHSNGFEGQSSSTFFAAGAEATVADGESGRPSDYDWSVVLHKKDLPSLEKMGREAVRRARAKVGQAKMESGTYDMIIENRSATRLVGAMFQCLQGRALQQKRSYLEGKIGEKIASEKLTVIDDPLIVGGQGSRLYDGDGIAAKKRVIIDKGVLKSYYIDYYYSRKLGMEPTTGGSSNVIIEPGEKTLEQLIAQSKKGILVTGFIGGNSNTATGDFSYGIIGQLIENGKLVKPVNEMNLSGNLTEIWEHLVEMGNDPYPNSAWLRPSMFFRDIFFSGV